VNSKAQGFFTKTSPGRRIHPHENDDTEKYDAADGSSAWAGRYHFMDEEPARKLLTCKAITHACAGQNGLACVIKE